jgi:DNA ligase (NAD+)
VGFSGGGAKIRHRVPMLSMGKAKNLEETEKWLKRLDLPAETALTVQPKIDGLSASLYYRDSQLRYVATRGDGESGQDISHISAYLDDIPSNIHFTDEPVEIRGELHLPKDTGYETGGKPLRNNCVGLINRKDDRENLHFVRFLAYQIVWPESGHLSSGGTAASISALRADPRLASEFEKIDILKENGFYTFDKWRLAAAGVEEPEDTGMVSELVRQIGGVYEEYIDSLRDGWNFETDGLIIAVDNNTLHDGIDERWVVDHHHHYSLAFKPPSQAALTPLREVLWQVSRQGNLTPVAVFEPIEMGGATLERASLHNADNVRRLKLADGDRILVERANDVIPYVRDNPSGSDREEDFKDPSLWPEVCPSCGSIPEENGVNLTCLNPECRDRVLQSILYWVRQGEIEQVALKSLEALYDAGKLRTIRDLYTLKAEDFTDLEGFGDKKIANFVEQVSAARSMSAVELISRLGIPMVQKKSLARLGISTLEDFYSFEDDSYVIGQRIVQWKNEPGNLEFLNQLLEVIDIREDAAVRERRGVVCLTGKAPVPRKALSAALESRGWSVAGAVTKETILVVCDDPTGRSTKLKKARDAGIEIMTYEDFLQAEGLDLS